MGGVKSEGVGERRRTFKKEKSILMTAHISVLLVFEVLPDGEDILSRAIEITRKDALIRMREQICQSLDLPRELGVCRHIELRRWARRPPEERRALEGIAPTTHGQRRR